MSSVCCLSGLRWCKLGLGLTNSHHRTSGRVWRKPARMVCGFPAPTGTLDVAPCWGEDERILFCHLSWLQKMGPCQFSTIKNLSTEEIEDHQAVFQHAALWHMCCKTPWGPLSLLSYPQTHCSQGCCWPEHSELGFTNRICASKFIRGTEPHMGWYLWYFGLAVTRLYISNQTARSKGSQRCEPQEEEDCREHHPVLGKSYKVKPVADYCIQKNYYH